MKKSFLFFTVLIVFILSACQTHNNLPPSLKEEKQQEISSETIKEIPLSKKTVSSTAEFSENDILQTYINEKAEIKINYDSNIISIKSINILDLPKETEYGPTTIFGQNDLFKDKEKIEKTSVGEKCTNINESGSAKSEQAFCQIQEQGDIKGKMEITESPNDAEWINVRFTFYKDNYKFILWPYNAKCGPEKAPCSLLQRWDGRNNLISTEKIIDAYKNDTELKETLFNLEKSRNEIIDFNKIFISFKNTLKSIEIENNLINATGTYNYYLKTNKSTPYKKTALNRVCFEPAQMETINNGQLFCFNNTQEALKILNIKNIDNECQKYWGTAEIKIKNLSNKNIDNSKSAPCVTEGTCEFNEAELVEVIEFYEDAPQCEK